jgi:Tol biopolymer transport system component
MLLSAGTRLGPYEILAPIGAGGMGEVYRTRDTRLNREVAIKVSAERFSDRFEREAHSIAALNHTNICTLYDVGPNYLVMELVGGPTLAERIKEGPVALAEALTIARQVADALEAAHEKGIIHRDLKPANVKVTPEGVVKVLDFGLAKMAAPDPTEGNPEKSPTLSLERATRAGVILGTAAYMSPEQASGKRVDKRADIWSFGVVLWELLTSRRLFEGETVTDTLAGVLRSPIDFDQLPRDTPPAIRALLRRCLDRNPKNRLRDIGEARVAIDGAFQPVEPAVPAPKRLSSFVWIAATVVFGLSLAALAFFHFRETPPERQHVRFQINSPEGQLGSFKLSPDGRFLAFTTGIGSAERRVWIRSLDGLDTRLLTDIHGIGNFSLFWSWDGEHIAFQFRDKLYTIGRDGGTPVVLTDAPLPILGCVWLDNGVIVFGTASGLFRVSSSGGPPVKIDDQSAESLAWLPGRRFLCVLANGIFAESLDGRKPVQILPDHTLSAYVLPLKPGRPGHLLFVRGETLWAQSFNADRLELQGDAIPVAARVSDLPGIGSGAFTASANGVLVFGRGNSQEFVLTWLDRAGKRLQSVSKPFNLARNPAIRLSPNDSQAIVPIAGANGTDLWIADLNHNTLSRFTFNGSFSGLWSPDGRKVLWAANDGNRYLKSADGSGKDELLFKNPTSPNGYVNSWSSNGRLVSFAGLGEKTALQIWLVPIEGDRKPYPYFQANFAAYWEQISPDDRWIAYVADQTNQPQQVYVESIPAGKGRWQISTERGDWPIWRRDGKELFYRQGNQLMAVPMRLSELSVESGNPQELFEVPPGNTRFQVSRDGQRFLIALPVEGTSTSTPLTVDTDWRAELAK